MEQSCSGFSTNTFVHRCSLGTFIVSLSFKTVISMIPLFPPMAAPFVKLKSFGLWKGWLLRLFKRDSSFRCLPPRLCLVREYTEEGLRSTEPIYVDQKAGQNMQYGEGKCLWSYWSVTFQSPVSDKAAWPWRCKFSMFHTMSQDSQLSLIFINKILNSIAPFLRRTVTFCLKLKLAEYRQMLICAELFPIILLY